MSTRSRIGAAVGGVSIGLSTLCFLVMPAFTPAILIAVFIGFIFGIAAALLGARRTAGVAVIFALVPLLGFFVMEAFAEKVGTGFVAFVPLLLAGAIGGFAARNYLRVKNNALSQPV
jgi:hypothetical protein